MKTFKIGIVLLALGFFNASNAQEAAVSKENKQSYYQKRAMEDAKYEQQF